MKACADSPKKEEDSMLTMFDDAGFNILLLPVSRERAWNVCVRPMEAVEAIEACYVSNTLVYCRVSKGVYGSFYFQGGYSFDEDKATAKETR